MRAHAEDDDNELYVIEYNFSNNVDTHPWHIQPLELAVSANASKLRAGKSDAWLPVGIAVSYAEAHRKCDILKSLVKP